MIKKMRFYKRLLIEIIETLCTLCLYMYTEAGKFGGRNHYTAQFKGHFDALGAFSEELRKGKT